MTIDPISIIDHKLAIIFLVDDSIGFLSSLHKYKEERTKLIFKKKIKRM